MSEEYCVGVKILLERMETNPEEFVTPINTMKGAKWSNLMSGIIARKLEKDVRGDGNFLTEAEVDAVFKKYTVLRRKQFDDHVMREVLGADEELSSPSPPVVLYTGGGVGGGGGLQGQAQLIEKADIQRRAFMAQQNN